MPSCLPELPLISFSENSRMLEQCSSSSSSSSLSRLGSSSRFQLPSRPVDTVLLSSPSTKAVLSSSLTKLSSFYISIIKCLLKSSLIEVKIALIHTFCFVDLPRLAVVLVPLDHADSAMLLGLPEGVYVADLQLSPCCFEWRKTSLFFGVGWNCPHWDASADQHHLSAPFPLALQWNYSCLLVVPVLNGHFLLLGRTRKGRFADLPRVQRWQIPSISFCPFHFVLAEVAEMVVGAGHLLDGCDLGLH